MSETAAPDERTLSDGPPPAPGRGPAEAGWTAAMEKLAAHLGG